MEELRQRKHQIQGSWIFQLYHFQEVQAFGPMLRV